MTMFTEGRLQAYERMMQQRPNYHARDREKPDRKKNRTGAKKPVTKDGETHERHQG